MLPFLCLLYSFLRLFVDSWDSITVLHVYLQTKNPEWLQVLKYMYLAFPLIYLISYSACPKDSLSHSLPSLTNDSTVYSIGQTKYPTVIFGASLSFYPVTIFCLQVSLLNSNSPHYSSPLLFRCLTNLRWASNS